MKIAYVGRVFGPITGGGVGTYLTNVTVDMVRRGHQVYLVSSCFTPENMHYLPVGVTLVPVDPAGETPQNFYYTDLHKYNELVYRALLDLSQKVDLDIIEFPEHSAEGFTTIRAKRLLGQFASIRLVVKLHIATRQHVTFQQRSYTNYDYETAFYMEDYCIRHADLVTSPSADLARLAQERFGIQPVRSLLPLTLEGSDQPRQFDLSQTHRVMTFGTVNPIKGFDYFIEAAQKVLAQRPDFSFEIYGRDSDTDPFGRSYTNYLKWQIPAQLRDKIVFKGRVPFEQVVNVLQSAAWCVLPSRWDNWPNACLEAMTAGCVVIGTKNGGMREMIVDGQSGFVVDPSDTDRIARLIMDHSEDVEYLTLLSRQAQLDVKKWADPDLICEQIEQGYAQALAQPDRLWQTDLTPLVSVVLPHFNQGHCLTDALASVKASTYANYEIVIVHDGSTDPTLCEGLEGLDVPVIKVAQPNRGIGSARNAGVAASQGEIIVTLDPVARLHPQFLEKAVQALVNNPDLACVTANAQYQSDSATYTHHYLGLIPPMALFSNTITGSLIAARREALIAVGGYDEERTTIEDWDLQLKLYTQGYQTDVLPGSFLTYPASGLATVDLDASPLKFLVQYLLQRYPTLLEKHRLTLAQLLTDQWQLAHATVEGQAEWIQIQADAISYYRGVEQAQLRQIEELQAQLSPAEQAEVAYTQQLEESIAAQQAEAAWLEDVLTRYQNGRFMRLLARLKKFYPKLR